MGETIEMAISEQMDGLRRGWAIDWGNRDSGRGWELFPF